MRRRIARLAYIVFPTALILGGVHYAVNAKIEGLVNVSVEFGGEADEQSSREDFLRNLAAQQQRLNDNEFVKLPKAAPFREIDAFDKDALDWSNFFDGYATQGALVFDANGDGRLDVYLTHNNNTWTRPTDENSVLLDKPYISGNGLYLNLGNGSDGLPTFRQIKHLVRKTPDHATEELVVEDFLYPRTRPEESTDRVGRSSACAIAADLNNDGLVDLLVGNILPGMLWSSPETQRVLGQFVRPVGRQAVNTKVPLRALGLYFLKDYRPDDDRNDWRESARGREPMGANSVYLNLGDKDKDGIPEWKDVSREYGLEGSRTTMALLAADFDVDGDLDIFEANIMDMDYWPGGATALAGAANQLYLNQLVETGITTFKEVSGAMDVDGLYDDNNPIPKYYKLDRLPVLPDEYSVARLKFEPYEPDFLTINGEQSEPGQISWAAVTQDVNLDGYPDIWVANDLGFLRLYINEQGRRFKLGKHPRSNTTGYWMSLSPADYNGDGVEDLFAGNMGGASMNLAMPIPDMYMMFEPVMSSSTVTQQFFGGHHNSMHSLIDGATGFSTELPNKVRHSRILPPDASMPNNIRDFAIVDSKTFKFDPDSIDPYEFTWGSTSIDIQNDGRHDLYWVGCLQGRGGGTFPIMGTGPGRLLVNATKVPAVLRFVDQTAEHRLLNILELQYDKLESHGYIYRKSPLQNWGKRSVVHSYDVSVWGFHGPGIVERITNHDLIQTAENGRAAVAADVNNDGYADILVRNIGGYDSRRSNARNLRGYVNGRVEVIPAHDANFPTPTNYDPGTTRLFINSYSGNNWIKVDLLDDSGPTRNQAAIGASVLVNDEYLQVKRSGGGGFASNYYGPLLFGLGQNTATTIQVVWPDKDRTMTRLNLPEGGLANGLLTISRSSSKFDWKPHRREGKLKW